MGLVDRDYTNRNYTNRNYDANNIHYTQDESTKIQKSNLFCEYCRKEIEIKLLKETQKRSKIENGLVIDESVEVIVEKQDSLICSTCSGIFCPSCIESFYKDNDKFVLTNICKRCQEKADEEKKKTCTHNYLRRFIRNDKYFDYYELECLYCGDKKGIAEPIEKIEKEEPKSTQKNTTQTKSKSQNKGISKIIDSIKGLFR